jgi:5-bromo-4-chloroindolyl phosphate hydrolysis protein
MKGIQQPHSEDNGMIDETDHLRARRNNVRRYRRLLQTELTDLERRYIERRLNEEKSAMETLTSSTVPLQNPRTDSQIYTHSLAAEENPSA